MIAVIINLKVIKQTDAPQQHQKKAITERPQAISVTRTRSHYKTYIPSFRILSQYVSKPPQKTSGIFGPHMDKVFGP